MKYQKGMNLQPQAFNVGYPEATKIVLLYSLTEKHYSSLETYSS